MKAILVPSLLALVVAATSPALAQTSEEASRTPDNDDIIVTARRVAERLQDVPVAVTAIQGEKLSSLGVTQAIDLRQAVPGLQITTSVGRSTSAVFAIRGQRAQDVLITQDQPISIYIDDAVVAPPQGSNLGLFDLENVQVLKGPQGTLFGRNTTGGAVLFTTAKPTSEFGGSLKVGYGNYDAKTATAILNVPVNEQIHLRGAVDFTKNNGFGRILAGPSAGAKTFSRDELNFRFTVAVDPTDWLQTMTTFYHSRANNGISALKVLDSPNASPFSPPVFVFGQAALGAFARSRASGRYDFEGSRDRALFKTRVKGIIHTDTVQLDDNIDLKHIFAYRKVFDQNFSDLDGTGLPLLDSAGTTNTKVFSDEVQLQGKAFDSKLEYIFGVYYYSLTGTDGFGLNDDPVVQFGSPYIAAGRIKNTSFSGFGQATYNFTDTLSATAGLRYTVDQRKATLINGSFPLTTCNFVDANGAVLEADRCSLSNSTSFAKPSYLFSINKKLNEDTLVYLSHRYSYRAGGYNLRADNTVDAATPFRPETVKDVEFGIKAASSLGDIRLTANLAAYYQWYSDIQKGVSVTGPSGRINTLTRNAAKAHIYGGELELGLRYERLIDLTFNYALVKAQYDEYNILGLVGGVSGQPVNYTNRLFQYIPAHQISGNLIISPDIGAAGELRLITNVYYQSFTYFGEDYQNRVQLLARLNPLVAATQPTDTKFGQPGYALVNGRVELNSISGTNLSLAVWGRNLFNKRYIENAIPFSDSLGFQTGVYGAPRTYGIEASYKF